MLPYDHSFVAWILHRKYSYCAECCTTLVDNSDFVHSLDIHKLIGSSHRSHRSNGTHFRSTPVGWRILGGLQELSVMWVGEQKKDETATKYCRAQGRWKTHCILGINKKSEEYVERKVKKIKREGLYKHLFMVKCTMLKSNCELAWKSSGTTPHFPSY